MSRVKIQLKIPDVKISFDFNDDDIANLKIDLQNHTNWSEGAFIGKTTIIPKNNIAYIAFE